MADIIYLNDIFPSKFKKGTQKTALKPMSVKRVLKSSLMERPKAKQQSKNNLKSEK